MGRETLPGRRGAGGQGRSLRGLPGRCNLFLIRALNLSMNEVSQRAWVLAVALVAFSAHGQLGGVGAGGDGPVADTVVPDVTVFDERGNAVPLRDLCLGKHTVLIAGCLTCPIFRGSYPGVEAVARDYRPKGVQFFYFYKALAHPEYRGYVAPLNLEERLLHISRAKEELGTSIPWLADTMEDALRLALKSGPNSEYLIDPGGKIIYSSQWSDAGALRAALAKVMGSVESPTATSSLHLPAQPKPGRADPRESATRVVRPEGLVTLKVRPTAPDEVHYVKLRAEAEPELLSRGKGRLYLGFFPDPIRGAHWNNLAPPMRFSLVTPSGVKAEPREATAAAHPGDSDTEPREFWVTLDGDGPPASVGLKLSYHGCTDTLCLALAQEHTIVFERDDYGGWTFGFSPRRTQGRGARPQSQAAAKAATGESPGTRGPMPGGMGERHPSPAEILQSFDRDKDGKIAPDEAPERMRSRWKSLDADEDNFVTLAELEARDARVSGGQGARQPVVAPRASAAEPSIPGAVAGVRVYVNAASKAERPDGKTWATAFASLQEALASNAAEIWVARGTYTPGGATFQLRSGGAVYGGFSGTETRVEQRDWRKHKTVLDGDGAAHVVTGADGAVLDGFTVTGGNAVGGERGAPSGGGPGGGGGRPIHMTPDGIAGGSGVGCGAGMLNFRACPTVRNCVFESNTAGKGGAVYNMTSAGFPPRPGGDEKVPRFINCVFRKNVAQGRGGGVANDLGTSPLFLNCVFEENETPRKGGGMYNDFACSPILINCLFVGNRAQSAGGMGNDGGSSPVLRHCTFTRNHAEDYGAPMYQGTGPANNPALIDCVVADNTCEWGEPGLYNWHGNAPKITSSAAGDNGYRPGRFTEADLPELLDRLREYRAAPDRRPGGVPVGEIPFSGRVVYADAAAATGGDGRSWATAYSALTAALEDAGRDGAEVRVAAGTYRPGGDRASSFVLRPGVRLVGGYRGDVREPSRHVTVLDGNGGYHVLVGANGTTIDGLTIRGGRADGEGYAGKGGGLVAYRDGPQGRPNAETAGGFSMTISRCVFTNNVARDGGAVYSYDRARLRFADCAFAGNRADNGGAVLDRVGVESVFERCEFIGNEAMWRGGALYVDYGSRPRLTGCVFRGNSTGGHGGAIFSVSRASQLENSVVALDDCRFEDNAAKGDGGAAAFCDSSIGTITNCAFAGNRAGRNGNDVFTDDSSAGTSGGGASRPGAGAARVPQGEKSVDGRGATGRSGGVRMDRTFLPMADFSVLLLGTGGPPYDPRRSGPSAAIQHRGRCVLVDMGNGTQARLYEAGISPGLIDALVLTHHHRDHNEEFMPLLASALMRAAPIEVIGPPGTRRLADFATEFYAEDIAYRLGRTGRSAKDAPAPGVREVQGGERIGLSGMDVRVAQVPHTIHTVAYRFDAGGRSIVISGDLTYSDQLIDLARDADVLIIDSGGSIVRPGQRSGVDGPARRDSAHASARDVANMAQKAGVGKLVLTHIVADAVDEPATIQAIGEIFRGEVVVGHDLLEVTCGDPAGMPVPRSPRAKSERPAH